jgi:hypothetical protein
MTGEQYSETDIEIAYDRAGGDTWDDLLQYLESGPSEDFEDLSDDDIAEMAEQVRYLMEQGRDYPSTADELRELLAQDLAP